MSSLVVLQQMAVIAILVSIGFLLCRKGVLDKNTTPKISKIVVDICNPAVIVATVLSGNITVTHREFLIGLATGAALYLTFCILGILIPIILRIPKDEKKFYELMTVYTNVGFLGIPVAKAILPENAMIYVIICNVAYSLLFYTHGIMRLSRGKSKMSLTKILNPGVIMAVFALFIFWFDISLPPILTNSFTYIGNPTVFLSMILLGGAVAESNFINDVRDLKLWIFILIRMVAVPLAVVIILKSAGVPSEMMKTFCLMSAVPVGNLPLIQAQKSGERTDILSKGIIVTTVFSFLSITVFMAML